MAYERLNLNDGITFNATHVKHLEDGIAAAQEAAHEAAEAASGCATEEYVNNKIAEAELGGGDVDLSGYAQKSELPTKTSQLTNDSGFLTDAPVKSVNGKTGTVSLAASDVGALPAGTKIPQKTSELTNDSGYITGYTETDPTVPSWAKQAKKPTYTAAEVGALPASTVIPSKLSDMSEDATHRTVTDTEKAAWNAKGGVKTVNGAAPDAAGNVEVAFESVDIGITRVESMDTSNLVNLRDLETGPYVLYGYFSPYANSDMSMTFDNTIVIVARKSAGSHLFVLTGLNSKINFLEILVDDTAPGGHTYSRTDFTLLDMHALIEKVGSLDELETDEKASIVAAINEVAKKEIPTKVSQLQNDKGYLTEHQDISGKLDASALPAAVDDALAQAKASGEFDGKDGYTPIKGKDYFDGEPGYTPVKGVDYYTEADKSEFSEYIATELAKRGQLKPEFANSIEECTDTTKLYVLPDGFIYAYILTEKEVESKPTYTNLLPTAINADGSAYTGTNGEKGYKTGHRLNSSAVESEQSGMCCTGYMPYTNNAVIRLKNVTPKGTKDAYAHFYDANKTLQTTAVRYPDGVTPDSNGVYTITSAPTNGVQLKWMRFSLGTIDDTSIITVDEEITDGGGTTIVTEEAWTNTGLAFVPADYEDRIIALEQKVGISGGNQIDLIRNWNSPIYDDAPVFLCSANKPVMGTQSVAAVYAKYDALMAAHPNYITKTDLGLASDGKTHIYRYDFCEPRTRKNPESSNHPDLVKPKAIIVSGIHTEYAGIYALYYALEEIANNKELYSDLRNNTHLIVVPCVNPYCLESANYTASNGRKNANGVEIHRNFEVDHVVIDSSSNNYGGETPLSEVESQYVDNIMAENTDAAFFLSCHNYDYDTYFGSGFIWPSVATRYMYNMGSRLIDKMSRAWLDKYGDTFKNGVDSVKTSAVSDGDYTVGMVGMSGSPGTEAKHAMKYGIHGTNVEIAKMFKVFNSTVGSAEVMTHGAEVYINFLRIAFGCYDHKDKNLYQI